MHGLFIEKSRAKYTYRNNRDGNFVSPNGYQRMLCTAQYYPKGDYAVEYADRFMGSEDRPITAKVPGQIAKMLNIHNGARSVRNKARDRYHEQLRTAPSMFEDWYERQQTYKLIGDSLRGVLSLTRSLKNPAQFKHKVKKGAKLEAVPAAWLTYQFGITPALGTMDRLINGVTAPFPPYSIRAGASGTITVANMGITGSITFTGYIDYTYSLGSTLDGLNPNSALIGLTGLNEPFSSAWNVIPWGWAVDYFANIGSMLSNIENRHPGVSVKYPWSTTYFTFRGRLYDSQNGWEGEASTEGFYQLRRTKLSSDYELTWDFPLLGSNQAANLSSAIALTLKGKAK